MSNSSEETGRLREDLYEERTNKELKKWRSQLSPILKKNYDQLIHHIGDQDEFAGLFELGKVFYQQYHCTVRGAYNFTCSEHDYPPGIFDTTYELFAAYIDYFLTGQEAVDIATSDELYDTMEPKDQFVSQDGNYMPWANNAHNRITKDKEVRPAADFPRPEDHRENDDD